MVFGLTVKRRVFAGVFLFKAMKTAGFCGFWLFEAMNKSWFGWFLLVVVYWRLSLCLRAVV